MIKNVLKLNQVNSEKASEIIKEKLNSKEPLMIARFGSTEIKAMIYPNLPYLLKPFFKKLMNYNEFLDEFLNMKNLSGFFPANYGMLKQFSELMIKDIKSLDILGSWRIEELLINSQLQHCLKVKLNELEPYFHKNPWSEVLEDKNILIIHPFSNTIEYQYYNNREKLFKDPIVLPMFKSLQTIKAVQTIAGEKSNFSNWFEALDFMKNKIDEIDFDIAIIGAGAYGFPLAAHIKRKGKKAIHLGGATQILFGIKGRRWEENEKFKNILNEYFVYPSQEETPKNSNQVENGCYW